MSTNPWKLIETCPKDEITWERPCDVWVVTVGAPKDGPTPYRVCNVHWGGASQAWINSDGQWFTGRRYIPSDDDDWHYDPCLTDEGSDVVTHWMYPPGAPE